MHVYFVARGPLLVRAYCIVLPTCWHYERAGWHYTRPSTHLMVRGALLAAAHRLNRDLHPKHSRRELVQHALHPGGEALPLAVVMKDE